MYGLSIEGKRYHPHMGGWEGFCLLCSWLQSVMNPHPLRQLGGTLVLQEEGTPLRPCAAMHAATRPNARRIPGQLLAEWLGTRNVDEQVLLCMHVLHSQSAVGDCIHLYINVHHI